MNGSLRIGKLHVTCHVGGLRFAPAVRDRVSRACRDHVPVALRGAARWLDGDKDSVWIVRRIDLSIVARIEAPPDQIAGSIARSLGHALAKALTDNGDGTNAIRFRDRAAYLSRFITDVAAGTAWRRWYYAPLSGWRLLPPSAVIRSALVENPTVGLDVLRTLQDRELDNVVECLSAVDERLVLNVLADIPIDPAASGAAMNEATARHFREAPFSRSRRPLIHLARSASLKVEPRAVGANSDHRPTNCPSPNQGAVTKFGGIVLLLRDVNALPWADWMARWPEPADGVSPATCLKWITLAVCSGEARVETMLADAVWRNLLGIPQTLTLRAIAEWLRAVGPERRRTLAASAAIPGMTRTDRRWLGRACEVGISPRWRHAMIALARLVYSGFARRLPGFGTSSVDYLWRNFLDVDADVEWQQDRVIVRCGPATLHLVLALTGMTRGLAAGTDGRGRPILVFSRE